MLRAVFFASTLCLLAMAGPIIPQTPPERCGALSPGLCALVETTQRRWNERFADQLELMEWRYLGPAEQGALEQLYSADSNSLLLTVEEETGEFTLRELSEVFAAISDTGVSDTYSDLTRQFSENEFETVEFVWVSGDETYRTVALVSNMYPYLIDTIVASVIIAVQPYGSEQDAEICLEYKYEWVNRIPIGLCQVFLYSTTIRTPMRDDEFFCDTKSISWNRFGGSEVNTSSPVYEYRTCVIEALCGFTSPFATVKIGREPLVAEFGGIGNGWTVERSCRLAQ